MRNFYSTIDSKQLWCEVLSRRSSGGCYISVILQGVKDHDSEGSQNGSDPEILQNFKTTLWKYIFNILKNKKEACHNFWTRCKPNVQKSIKSTMKPKCFNVQTCHDHGPSVFPSVTLGSQWRGPQWCVTSINIADPQRRPPICPVVIHLGTNSRRQ